MSSYSEYMKSQKQKNIDFLASIYDGLGFEEASNKYCEITKRVNEEETKVLLNVSSSQIFNTQYGYGLIVGHDKVVWLKSWQVFRVTDWWATEWTRGTYQVLLNKEYYKVNQSNREFDGIEVGDCASDSDFEKENGYHSWKDIVEMAKAQQEALKDSPIKFRP